MEKVSTIGLDIAKHVFQVHGVDALGAVVRPPEAAPGRCRWVLQGIAAVPDRNRGVRDRTPLGSGSHWRWVTRFGLCRPRTSSPM